MQYTFLFGGLFVDFFKGKCLYHVFLFRFMPSCLIPLNRQPSTFKIYCAVFTITSNGSAVIHVVCGHEYYVNTLIKCR